MSDTANRIRAGNLKFQEGILKEVEFTTETRRRKAVLLCDFAREFKKMACKDAEAQRKKEMGLAFIEF